MSNLPTNLIYEHIPNFRTACELEIIPHKLTRLTRICA